MLSFHTGDIYVLPYLLKRKGGNPSQGLKRSQLLHSWPGCCRRLQCFNAEAAVCRLSASRCSAANQNKVKKHSIWATVLPLTSRKVKELVLNRESGLQIKHVKVFACI